MQQQSVEAAARTNDTRLIGSSAARNSQINPSSNFWLFALLGWTCVICFAGLYGGAEFEPTDCWVAQTAREMYENGNWLIPVFSGETRMQKSPGPYWAVMLSAWFRDTPIDEAAARTPNAIAGVLMVATIFWLSRRIAGERVAVITGFASASSVLVLYWTHRGASDFGLATLTTISLAALWVATADERPGWKRGWLWVLGYFAAGLGMLYKMPMPLVLIGLPAFVYVLVTKRWAAFLSPWHLVGVVAFFLPWLPWVVAASVNEPAALAKWKVEFFDRFTGDLPNVEGQRAYVFFYFLPLMIYCLPYSLSLPQAMIRAFREQDGVKRDGRIFLLVWALSHFAFFTAAAGKETRYFLPAIPPFLILLGIELSHFFNPQRAASPTQDRRGFWAVAIGLPAGFIAAFFGLLKWQKSNPYHEWSTVWPPYVICTSIFTIGMIVAAWLYIRRREHQSFGVLVGTMCVFWMLTWSKLMPIMASERPARDFADQLTELRTTWAGFNETPIYQVGSQDARITWYSDVRFPRVIDQLRLLELQGGKRSRRFEIRLIGEEMIRKLEDSKPVLFVSTRADYVTFLTEAPKHLAEVRRAMPESHLWLQTRIGPPNRHFVLFGNKPPPWPEPALNPPSDRLNAGAEKAEARNKDAQTSRDSG